MDAPRYTGRLFSFRRFWLGALFFWAALPVSGQNGAKNGEWRYYGGDAGSTKYSPLDQINKDNVKDLRIAWRWKSENFGPRPDFNWEATPLMVGGVLYITAGTRRDVVAIDAATGETLWLWRLRRRPARTDGAAPEQSRRRVLERRPRRSDRLHHARATTCSR